MSVPTGAARRIMQSACVCLVLRTSRRAHSRALQLSIKRALVAHLAPIAHRPALLRTPTATFCTATLQSTINQPTLFAHHVFRSSAWSTTSPRSPSDTKHNFPAEAEITLNWYSTSIPDTYLPCLILPRLSVVAIYSRTIRSRTTKHFLPSRPWRLRPPNSQVPV
jgi:hypothetical protein